jgi:hypothetical protein
MPYRTFRRSLRDLSVYALESLKHELQRMQRAAKPCRRHRLDTLLAIVCAELDRAYLLL